jgi:hypothetical protein
VKSVFRFFHGIHWLLLWMVIYVSLTIFVVPKHDADSYWNLAAMLTAWFVVVLAMWIRSLL